MRLLFRWRRYAALANRGWVEVIEREVNGATTDSVESEVDGLKPLQSGTPIGLCDSQGTELREGDILILAHSNVRWQVRFSEKHGFIGYYKDQRMEIWFSLELWERIGALLHRRWLRDITKEA